MGSLRVGALTYAKATDKPLAVQVAEAVTRFADPVTVTLPLFKGAFPVIDMQNVVNQENILEVEDCTLATPTPDPKYLRLDDGILYGIHNTGTVIMLR